MTRKAQLGDVCLKCGDTVRTVIRKGGDLSSSFDPTEESVTCGCNTLAGPTVADETPDV